MVPTIDGWVLALTRALFGRSNVHARRIASARLELGCTLPGGAAHTFEAYNLTRTAQVQCTDFIQPCDSESSNVAFGTCRSGLRLPRFRVPRPSAQSREQTTVVLRFDLARSLSCLRLSDTTTNVDDRTMRRSSCTSIVTGALRSRRVKWTNQHGG